MKMSVIYHIWLFKENLLRDYKSFSWN